MCAKKLSAYLDPTRFLFGHSRKRDISKYDFDEGFNDESNYYSSAYEGNSAPLRFIIIRHGERVDVVYGGGWTERAFDRAGRYTPFDSNMPPSLPYRANCIDYDVDTPLTANGLSQSWNVGNALAKYNLPVTACYSSPAFRSIQTANGILEGMGRKAHIPIRLEVGLFECTSWYARCPINFMGDDELLHGGYNIDMNYHSQLNNLRLLENEYQYYDRSKETMKKIIRLHEKTGGNILLVAHAPSLEVLTRHLMHGQPRPERLAELSGKVDFCSMTIIERESSSAPWQFRYSLDQPISKNIYYHQQQQQQQQQEPFVNGLVRAKPSNATSATAAVYPSSNALMNYSTKTPDSAYHFHFFPQQEAYPPHFVL